MFTLLGIIIVFAVLLINDSSKGLKFINFIMDKFGWIMLACVVLGIGMGVADLDSTFIYDEVMVIFVILLLGSPFLLIRYIVRKIEQKKIIKSSNTESDDKSIHLPESEDARRKVIIKFNDKFRLNLTEKQIETIVRSSYYSDEWANEIMAMTAIYKSEAEWFKGDTDWLRIYLKVFNVQNISSDFIYQKNICLENYEKVFSEFSTKNFGTIEDYIEAVNTRFLTNFDDITFMRAYRFLQNNGIFFELPVGDVVTVDDELDELRKKYDSLTSEEN